MSAPDLSVQEFIRQIEAEPAYRQRLAEALTRIERRRMTYAEFLEWADEDTLAEWVDGEVIMTSPASTRHQDLADFLTSVTRTFVEFRGLGVVVSAPFQMKLEHGREPDLLFVAREHRERLKENFLDGPADLVVEITSPESLERDRGKKYVEYEAAGIPEYWLLDPLREWAEFYQLTRPARYKTAFAGQEGIYRSVVMPGFWLKVEWLWQEPLPSVEEVLLEVGGESYARRWVERLRQRGFLPPSESQSLEFGHS